MIRRTSGRTAARSSIAPPIRPSTATRTIVWPSRCASSRPARISAGSSIPSDSMNRLLPTRTAVPQDADGDAVADLVLRVVGRQQGRRPSSSALWRMARAIGWWNFRSAAAAKARIRCGSQPRAAMIRPTSGCSRVSVPVLSKRTVSTWFIISRARPSLTRMPLLAHRVSELSIARGAAMRMPVPRSLLSTATAPMGPIVAMPSAPTPRVGITALSASRSPLCCEVIL